MKRQENHWAAVGGFGGGREEGERVGDAVSLLLGSIPFLPSGRDGGEERAREARGAQGVPGRRRREGGKPAPTVCAEMPSPALAFLLVPCAKAQPPLITHYSKIKGTFGRFVCLFETRTVYVALAGPELTM